MLMRQEFRLSLPEQGGPEKISQHSLFLPYLTIIFNFICVLT
ncbi:hypothetical protein CHCC20335_0689 [Bacillus paralicheniformis]|nr:hypothetical protein CHCC20335_0689 [Bacillus paralicheniformis]